ncbi:MAG: histidinol-phosphate transaminase [Gammaproteobacteria bacterium]|nr:MAG: histidinol-phosphate transaminase [Gammaproteobacteria bacterium]
MSIDVLSLAVPGVRAIKPYEPGRPIEEIEREYGVTDVVKLASNENPLGPGPRALAETRRQLTAVSRYPDGNGFALKSALADKLSVVPEQLTLGNGSNEILEFAARAFVLPENEVVFSAHAFAVYPLVTQAVGARAVITPAHDWGHDLEAMAQALNDRTRLIFLANPNNPTGTWTRRTELETFLERVPAHVLVVVDEAYFEYVVEPEYASAIAWIGRFPNLIVTRTFSKVHGLAGLRVGYGVSTSEVADVLNRVREPFNVNSLALVAAEAALADLAHVTHSVKMNQEGMQQLTAAFMQMGLPYIPSVANFIAVDVGRPGAAVYEALLREGVIVRPVANYGMPNHLRVTVGLPEENRRFVDALAKIVIRD